MIEKFSYSFEELKIDRSAILRLLGYPEGNLPELFSGYLDEAIGRMADWCQIQGATFISNQIRVTGKKDKLMVSGTELAIGRTVAKEIRYSEEIVLFICTVGEKISELSRHLLQGENPVMGYVYDILGSVAADSAAAAIQREISFRVATAGKQVTNRFSPGYCQWDVADQFSLFSFFPENCCGIRLTDSALMNPVKSVSGLFGTGRRVTFREYSCEICGMKDCFYRVGPK
jgi:hypothetical protein